MSQILLIEDDFKLKKLLEEFLESEGHEVICCSDGKEGFEAFEKFGCEVIVTDIRLPGMSGLELLQEITKKYAKHPPVILITGHGDKSVAISALRLGAFDFIEKPFNRKQLREAISRSQREAKEEITNFKIQVQTTLEGELTKREWDVANLVSQGMSNDEIGEVLSMSKETVKSHLKNIFRKLGLNNRTSLSAYMIRKRVA